MVAIDDEKDDDEDDHDHEDEDPDEGKSVVQYDPIVPSTGAISRNLEEEQTRAPDPRESQMSEGLPVPLDG